MKNLTGERFEGDYSGRHMGVISVCPEVSWVGLEPSEFTVKILQLPLV